jgi:hypothetical protein
LSQLTKKLIKFYFNVLNLNVPAQSASSPPGLEAAGSPS